MLAAARRLFGQHGYAQTSIRAIAAESGVNQGLIATYFGGKEALFMEAVDRFEIPQGALDGGIDGMGARIARYLMNRWENMSDEDPWPALLRSAFSHEASHQLLSAEMETELTAPLCKVLGETGDGPARTAMVQTLIGGMIVMRYLYSLEAVAAVPAPVFESALAASLQHAINGPLTAGESET